MPPIASCSSRNGRYSRVVSTVARGQTGFRAEVFAATAVIVGLVGGTNAGQVAETGSIAGQVEVVARSSRRLASAGAYPGRLVSPAPTAKPSERSNVVVFVKTGATAATPTHAVIHQQNETFVPHTTVITVGSTVDFPNDDIIFHNVFSLSRAASFDLGRYPRGSSKSRTFNEAGLVKVYCHLHSHMNAIVRVFDHPFFAVPDEAGGFTIDGLKPGPYEVVAWHERVGEVELSATVIAGQRAMLNFSLPLTDEE